MKCVAIFEVPEGLLVRALKALGALPRDAGCEVPAGQVVAVKAYDDCLPAVPEGGQIPRRLARAGNPTGELP